MSHQTEMSPDENKNEPVYPRMYIPDYNPEFKFLNKQLQLFLNSNHQKEMNAIALRMEESQRKMPREIPVKHHNHFDWGSKTLLFLIIVCVLCTLGSIIYAMNRDAKFEQLSIRYTALVRQNVLSADEAQYYYFVRAHFPHTAEKIKDRIAADSIGYLIEADLKMKNRKTKSK